ncbi:hypothetical protein [Phytopseudomonas dryadis]|uniref:hypothetical protein n=1 Tax=Phytopseudomonas dryadis TaxID=2487520 RepID=UPI0010383924|nr:hypothetical protein [Pseudomonas dryadis]
MKRSIRVRYMAMTVGVWVVIYLVAGLYAKYLGGRGVSVDCYVAEAQLAKDIQSKMVLLCLITLFGIVATIALRLWRYVIHRLGFNKTRAGREK